MMKSLKLFSTEVEPYVYAALRVVTGALFAFHGAQKLLGVYSTNAAPEIGSQIWIGGVIELVGGLAIALGLFTRAAAFLCSGMMAVAYFQFHWKLALDAGKWLPAVNKGELAVVYCFLFLFVAAKGSGAVSLDRLRGAESR